MSDTKFFEFNPDVTPEQAVQEMTKMLHTPTLDFDYAPSKDYWRGYDDGLRAAIRLFMVEIKDENQV